MVHKSINRENLTKLLIEIQDFGGIDGNVIATQAVKDFGLEEEHQRLTGNPTEDYRRRDTQDVIDMLDKSERLVTEAKSLLESILSEPIPQGPTAD